MLMLEGLLTALIFTIYSAIGSEIARYEVSGDVSTLTLPVKLESGVYFAKYISADFTSTTQILVK